MRRIMKPNKFIPNRHNQTAWTISWITLLMLITGSVYAFTLVKSDPTGGSRAERKPLPVPPAQIQLWFSEDVNQANISLSVYAENGDQVAKAALQDWQIAVQGFADGTISSMGYASEALYDLIQLYPELDEII